MRRIDNSALSNRASDGEILYPDSVGSSPRSSVGADKVSLSEEPLNVRWDEVRVKLMCSFGGRILPRPHDNQLRYVGGETRIVVVHRNIMYADLTAKLFKVFGTSLTVKYQLPSEDLDALISVTSDEDMENMMEEFDRLLLTSGRSSRLRLFLFPAQLDSQSSLSSLLSSSCNRENWFVDALNGMQISSHNRSCDSSIVSEATPDYLFGLDSVDEWAAASRSGSNPPEHFPEKAAVAPALGSLLQGLAGELPNSAPGSPLKRLPTSLSTSSAPPAMVSILSAAVDALKAESREPTSQATAVPQVTRDVSGQGSGLVSQENNPTNQVPVVPQVPRDAINQGPVVGSQDLGREPTNQAASVPQVQAPRDANSQGSVPVYKGREAEKNEMVEDRIPTSFTGAAGELISASKKDGSNQLSEGLLNDMTHKPPATGSNSSSQEQLVESLTVRAQKVSPQQLSNPPAEMQQLQQQQQSLPEMTAQAAKSSAAKQDPQSESAIGAGGKVLLNVGEENQTISAAGGKEKSKSVEEQQVLENFRKLMLDDKVSSDPRANQFEKEQSNFEMRQVDSTIRADAIAQLPVASKMVGESRFVQMLSSYNTPMQGIEEGLRLPQASSPPLTADAYSSSMVPPPPLPSQGMMRPIVPTQVAGDGDNTLRSTFYQQPQQSAIDEVVGASSRYATQGPAIKLPIMSSPAAAPVPLLFARSDTSRTMSRSPSPVAPPVHPQQQLMRQLQPTGVPSLAHPTGVPPLAHQPAGAPPLLSSNAGPPPPLSVYPSTSSQVEGVPMRGTPGIPVFTQYQRQVVNDPMQQFQRPNSPYWEYHTTAALPSRFRPAVSNQQAQYDAKVTAGVRPATAVPSSRPAAAPAQLYNYYNMEQLNAYAAAGMQGTVLYDPVNGAYIVGPNNSGGILPGITPLANANPFMDDTSGIVGTYQDVPDVPSNPQQAPGATVAGDNRLPGRQFIMRN